MATTHSPECDQASECPRCHCVICPDCFAMLPQEIDGETYCEDCVEKVVSERAEETASFAAKVKIIGKVTAYDPRKRSAPTREEYKSGDRAAHTENGVSAQNRHDATNYDALISDLNRDDALDVRSTTPCASGSMSFWTTWSTTTRSDVVLHGPSPTACCSSRPAAADVPPWRRAGDGRRDVWRANTQVNPKTTPNRPHDFGDDLFRAAIEPVSLRLRAVALTARKPEEDSHDH